MTTTSTRTPESLSRTRVAIDRPAGGGSARVSVGATGPTDRPLIRPLVLSRDDDGARVSLVPEGALLLAGDHVAVDIAVGPGARLELVEPAGTVAYSMDGGRASWDVTIDLAPSATLVWAGEPFVVSAGAMVDRTVTVRMEWGSVMALRETVVLGRHGERPGTLHQDLTVTGPNGVPVLQENLTVGATSSRLLLGGARVIGTVLLVGARMPETSGGTRFDLEAEGTMVRHLTRDAHRAESTQTWRAARRAVR